MQAFVDRFRYKASKAKQAQSMIKAIEKVKLTAEPIKDHHIRFSQIPERTVDVLADLKELDLGYGQTMSFT